MAQARMQGARALEGTKQGKAEERNEHNENEPPPPPPPPPPPALFLL